MTKGKTIIKGALILTLANLITRIMGFVYRIFMSKAIGTGGMGVYQLIMPVYLLVFSLCSSGLATAVSACTAANAAKKDYGATRKILNTSLAITACLSLAACAIVFFGAGVIGKYLLHEPRTTLSLKIIALCFPFMCIGACLRGYFYGLQKMALPAASQVLEQSVRILVVWLLCGKMISRGLEYACAMAVMGMACGEIVSFIFTVIVYRAKSSVLNKHTSLKYTQALQTVLSVSVPLTLNRGISSCLSTAENILIPQRLILHGMTSEQAISLFGGLCGMAVPLIMFPCSLLTALATALMPAISEYSSGGDYPAIGRALRRTLLFTTVIGIGVSGIFIFFPTEISSAVYGRSDIAPMLCLLGVICPFLYTQVILSAALNGINCQLYIFRLGLLSSAITISSILFLMPKYGIHAYIAAWALSAVITNALSKQRLERITDELSIKADDIFKCILSIIFVCICGKFLCRHLNMHGLVGLALLVGCCGSLYLYILDIMGVFGFGDIFALFLQRRKIK